jgi:hypothetical protein
MAAVTAQDGFSLVHRTLDAMAACGFSAFAVTGSLALETLKAEKGLPSARRPLNDLDLVVGSFNELPPSLADRFIFPHVHPDAAPGKILLQLVDPSAPLRVDVFRSRGDTFGRAHASTLAGTSVSLVSLEDLAARNAAHLMSLGRGTSVAPKHFRDLAGILGVVEARTVEMAWNDHRETGDPPAFQEAVDLAMRLVEESSGLLIEPEYVQDVEVVCQRCRPAGRFAPAPPREVMRCLGYC